MTKLTGRYIEFEMFPLSFEEYEGIKEFYGKAIASDRQEELQNYILEGGFPRTIQIDSISAKRRYVQSVIDEIFEKDIRRRLKIRNKNTFETVQKYIINNFGATTSLKSLKKAIEQSGTAISEATIARYIKALLDSKILCECPRFDMKSKKALSGEKNTIWQTLLFILHRIPIIELTSVLFSKISPIYTQDLTTTLLALDELENWNAISS